MATSRASHLIKGPRDHSDHASEATRRATPGCNRARKQQESWNGASTTAGASKEGTHWWIAGIHWIARHRLDNYEDRALMSPWPKPKNSTGQEGARFETPAARQNARRMQRKRGGKKKAGSWRQAKKRTQGETRRRTTPAGQGTQTEPAQSGPNPPLGGRDQNQQRKQTVEADERYSTPHCCTVAPHRQSGRDDDHARNKQAGDQCPTNTGQRARSRVTKRRSTHTAHIAQEK